MFLSTMMQPEYNVVLVGDDEPRVGLTNNGQRSTDPSTWIRLTKSVAEQYADMLNRNFGSARNDSPVAFAVIVADSEN
jgi:hypothetical protein